MDFAQFLTMRFIDWQKQEGGRKTVAQFADWLGVKQTTVSSWWNANSTPRDDVVISRLAVKLGMDVYDTLGLERPDPDLFYVQQHWHKLPAKVQRAIKEQAEAYVDSNEPRKRHVRPVDGTH